MRVKEERKAVGKPIEGAGWMVWVGKGGRQLAKLKGLVDDDGLENLMYR